MGLDGQYELLQLSITSYGADYPVDNIVKRLNSDAFFVPKFQRKFVWSQRHASRFVESLLMGLPVPGIFLYKDAKTSRSIIECAKSPKLFAHPTPPSFATKANSTRLAISLCRNLRPLTFPRCHD